MPHAKQATTIFALVLFLQAFQLCTSKDKTPSTLISPQTIDKELLLDEPIQGNANLVSKPNDVPEFDAEFHFDTKPRYKRCKMDKKADIDAKSDDESGYESDPNDQSSYTIDKEADVDANSGDESGYESDPELDKKNIDIDFEKLIQRMRETADVERDIKWHLSGDELTRSVGSNSGNVNLYTVEDYVVIALNIYRAAKMIFELHGKYGDELVKKAYEIMDYYQKYYGKKSADSWIKTIKNINANVVLYLKESNLFQGKSLDWINEKLRLAENYVGLDDTHYNVTTTFTIAGKKFALEDKKWLTLTEKQKQAYFNRQSEKWYKRLEPFEQKLIDHYWPKIVDGKHYIPTQLRSIPGCRNAYQKRILAYDENNNPTLLGRYYHSGSLPSPIEWEDKETDFQITKDNWDQITNLDKNVEVLSLNYNMDLPYFKQVREGKIIKDTKRVVGSNGFISLSANAIGTSCNLENGYDKLVEDTLAVYKTKYPDLCKILKKEQKNRRFLKQKLNPFKENPTEHINKQIEKITDPKDKSYFKLLIELRKAAKAPQIWNNFKQSTYLTGNPNVNIGASYIACRAMLSEASSTPPVLFSCKSGKDRTGYMSSHTDNNILSTSYPSLAGNFYRPLAYSGHYQFLASVNGGTPGRFGMKLVRGNTISCQFTQQLFPKTATFTTIDLVKGPVETIDE